MSLIGTMLKEPRVFTHSGTALSALESTWGVVTGVLTPQLVSTGQNYPAGPTAGVTTTGGSGTGLTVNVTAVAGVVTVLAVTDGGQGYRIGDIIYIDSILGEGTGAYIELIGANIAAPTAWAYGDPLSPILPIKGNPLKSVIDNISTRYEFSGTSHLASPQGATLYVGDTGSISVILEDPVNEVTGIPDKVVVFPNVQAGTFLPVKVLTVTASDAALSDIIAMY